MPKVVAEVSTVSSARPRCSAAPIPAGKRNNTLFAIGAEMKIAGIIGWQEQVYNRAVEVGLSDDEAEKLVNNIEKYAS